MTKASLSLCLIVRDGEQFLGRALDSVRPFVDEMVVVDTGSVDGSRDVAAARGAKVFDCPWEDSFSAARNQSLARATSDWIFWMDADDVLPETSGAELRRAIESCPGAAAAFWVQVEESRLVAGKRRVTSHGHVKLFPRRDEIRFCYRVHEQVAPAILGLGLPIRPSRAVVRHASDRSAAAQTARRERNLRLAQLDLAEHPGDPFVLLSLGITQLYRPGALDEAITHLRQSAETAAPSSPTQVSAYLNWGQALALARRPAEEESLYRAALAIVPDDAALLLRLATFYEKRGNLREAAAALHRLLARGRQRAGTLQVRTSPVQIALRLGKLYVRLGERERAERLWFAFLERQPKATAIRQALARSYLNSSTIIVKPD